jgi:xanthine/CO dehydrogenase XdhC/CoxF family maturation factor
MSELTDVLSAIESLSARGEKLALATIVAVRGSTYRRPGARLLVPEEGEMVGNISGGCLENDVADVAKIVMREGMARIVSFDLTADAVTLTEQLVNIESVSRNERAIAYWRRAVWPHIKKG